jgi:iron complex outermembrane receptor protein
VLKTTSAIAILTGVLVTSSANAQTAAPPAAQAAATAPDEGLTEIIVTAQRRAEPLQKTAASISVLTADTFVTAGVKNLNDVSRLVPNLIWQPGNTAQQPTFSLRGVPTVTGGDPPVAFVVDGVQAPSLRFVNQDLVDIASVQVLAGPQGGIYGRGAVGGALIIETQKPTNQFQDTLTLDGGNGGYFRAVNTVSGPIAPDVLLAKLTLQDLQFGGLQVNEFYNKPADTLRRYAGRLELLATPTSTTTMDLIYSHSKGRDNIDPMQNVPPSAGLNDFSKYGPIDYINQSRNKWSLDTVSLKVDQVTPIGTLTSVSQYAVNDTLYTGSGNWTPAPLTAAYYPINSTAYNEDLHLSSAPDQPINWIVGGFYQFRQVLSNLSVFVPTNGTQYCTTFGFQAGCPGGIADSFVRGDDHNNDESWAVYGQASVPLPANLKFNLALRYDSDRTSDQDLAIPAGPNNAITHTFSRFQPAATLSEQFTPDVMAYATVGQGFRSGGFNSYVSSVGSGGLVPRIYPAETNTNYEVGFKSQFFEHRLTVNGDIFRTDYTNDQYYYFNKSPPISNVVTIKSATVNGGELNVTYLPVEGLTLDGSLGVADSTINSNDPTQNDHGKHVPDANLYNANVSAMYRQPIFGDYGLLYRIDYAYNGPICYDSANTACFHSVGFLNGRIAVENNRYTLAIWAKNILSARDLTFINIGASNDQVIRNEPVTFGAEFIARF